MGSPAPFVLQLAGPHSVLLSQKRQRPFPSHMPSKPQVVLALGAHSLSGSVPSAWATQAPTLPVRSQREQLSVQAVWQQTPSAQKPDRHSAPSRQGFPLVFPPASTDTVGSLGTSFSGASGSPPSDP